jgi:hypothetical protein
MRMTVKQLVQAAKKVNARRAKEKGTLGPTVGPSEQGAKIRRIVLPKGS